MRLVTARVAAKYMGVGYGTVRAMVKGERIPVVNLPERKLPLIDLDDVDRLVEASKSGTVRGTKPFREAVKVVESSAPKQRRQKPKKTIPGGGKYEWMQQYAR